MSLKNLFLIFRKNEYETELKKKLTSLEINIMEIKSTLQSFQEQIPTEKIIKTKDPPIIIEKINIEKIIVDKYELNNNFGQLGIKELTGKLNIGATYGSEYSPNLAEEEKEDNSQTNKKQELFTEKGPKVNIKAKKD